MGNIGPVEFFAFAVLGAWFVGSGKAYAVLQALKSAPTTITNPTGNATGVIGAGGTTGTGGDTGGPGGQGTIGSGGGTGPGTTGTGGKTGGMGG